MHMLGWQRIGRMDGTVLGPLRGAVAAVIAAAALNGGTAAADDTAASAGGTVGGEAGSGFYVGTDIGVAFLSSVKIKDYAPTPGSLEFGIEGVKADSSAGLAWNLNVGYRFNESFAVELESGYYRNGFDGFSAGEFTTAFGLSTGIEGGDGDFTQIPVLLNAVFELPLMKPETPGAAGGLSLKLGAGLGVINVAADIDAITAVGVPGISAAVDGNSWELGGQVKIGLAWQLTHAIELGLEYRLMAVGGANFGTANFSDPLLVGTADVESSSVLTHAIQARISFEF